MTVDIFLHRHSELHPVLAGHLVSRGSKWAFVYAPTYLDQPGKIAISKDFPLDGRKFEPSENETVPSPIRDAAPDAWGRKALAAFGGLSSEPDDVTALVMAGAERIGALDVRQAGAVPMQSCNAGLEDIHAAVRAVAGGTWSHRDRVLLNARLGVGGMRPKALVEHEGRPAIAKFTLPSDHFEIVRAEFAAMRLASICGVNAAPVSIVEIDGDPVLIIDRFDRVSDGSGGFTRRMMASGLTVLGLEEMFASYASYEELFEKLVAAYADPEATSGELFRRMVFNILCGNTDDHARNHSAFWDGVSYELTPAYDICPQNRTGNEASQGMILSGRSRMSRLDGCVEAAAVMGIQRNVASATIEEMVEALRANYDEVCDMAGMTSDARRSMMGRQFLNPYIF